MNCSETYYGELFVQTLENIVNRYRPFVLLGMVPNISDPGGTGYSVTDGIPPEAFAGFFNKAKEHAELGRKALNETDAEESDKPMEKDF